MNKDVIKFIAHASDIVGGMEQQRFVVDMQPTPSKITSPIEQMVYIAFEALRRMHGYQIPDVEKYQESFVRTGFGLVPQFKVENYSVDFLGYNEQVSLDGARYLKRHVLVECDSQQFHDTTEKQRRDEKERERFLQNKGYHILRFTGREILDNPYKVAAEIMAFLFEDDMQGWLDPVTAVFSGFGDER